MSRDGLDQAARVGDDRPRKIRQIYIKVIGGIRIIATCLDNAGAGYFPVSRDDLQRACAGSVKR